MWLKSEIEFSLFQFFRSRCCDTGYSFCVLGGDFLCCVEFGFDGGCLQLIQILRQATFELIPDGFPCSLADQRPVFSIADADDKIPVRLFLNHDPDTSAAVGKLINGFIHT